MSWYTDRELEVAGILLEVEILEEEFQLRKRGLYNSIHSHPWLLGIRWGTKKRRSAEAFPLPPRTSSSLLDKRADDDSNSDKKLAVKIPEASTSSPPTPFSFPPSSDDTQEKDRDRDRDTDKDKDSPPTAITTAVRPLKKPKRRHKELVKEMNQEIAQLYKRIEDLKQEAAEARQQKDALMAKNSCLREQKIKCEEEQKRKQQEQHPHVSGRLLNLLPMGPTSSDSSWPHQWRHPVADADPTFTVEPRRLPVDHRIRTATEVAKSYPSQYEQICWVSPQLWNLHSGHLSGGARVRQLEPNTSTEALVSRHLHQQQQIMYDAKRAAMAEARKKRIEARKKSYYRSATAVSAAGIAVSVTSKPRPA